MFTIKTADRPRISQLVRSFFLFDLCDLLASRNLTIEIRLSILILRKATCHVLKTLTLIALPQP